MITPIILICIAMFILPLGGFLCFHEMFKFKYKNVNKVFGQCVQIKSTTIKLTSKDINYLYMGYAIAFMIFIVFYIGSYFAMKNSSFYLRLVLIMNFIALTTILFFIFFIYMTKRVIKKTSFYEDEELVKLVSGGKKVMKYISFEIRDRNSKPPFKNPLLSREKKIQKTINNKANLNNLNFKENALTFLSHLRNTAIIIERISRKPHLVVESMGNGVISIDELKMVLINNYFYFINLHIN